MAHTSKLLQVFSLLALCIYTVCALPRPIHQTTETARALLQTQTIDTTSGAVSNCSLPCSGRSHDIRSDPTEGGNLERRVVTNTRKTKSPSQNFKGHKPSIPKKMPKTKVRARVRSKGAAAVGRPNNRMAKVKKSTSKGRAAPLTKGRTPPISKKTHKVKAPIPGRINSRIPQDKKGKPRGLAPKLTQKGKGRNDVGSRKTTMPMARPMLMHGIIPPHPLEGATGPGHRIALSAVALNFDYSGDDNDYK